MISKLKGIVRYDGTAFSGWQVQPGQRTVQGTIEEALSRIAGEAVRVTGAGRTDSGVHALGQVVHFEWGRSNELERLRRSLSKMLGPEIRFESIEPADEEFHAIASAVGKKYAYAFCTAPEPDPFATRYAWSIPETVGRAEFERISQQLVGKHDFAGFCASHSSAATSVRTVHAITVHDGPVVGPADSLSLWHAEFFGNGFLYKMVRNMTGTIVDIARGATPEERLMELLESPGPFQGRTAPAHGLFMAEVLY